MQGRNPAEVEATSPYIAYQEAMITRFKQRKEFRLQEDEKMVFYFNIFTYNTICLTLVFILKLMEKELKLMEKEDKASDNQVVPVIKKYEIKTLMIAFSSYRIVRFINHFLPLSNFFAEARKNVFKQFGTPYYFVKQDKVYAENLATLSQERSKQTVSIDIGGVTKQVKYI